MTNLEKKLYSALEALYDVQNGPPVFKYEREWERAMQLAYDALTMVRNGSEGDSPLESTAQELLELLKQIVIKAPGHGPLWHGSDEMVAARDAIAKVKGESHE